MLMIIVLLEVAGTGAAVAADMQGVKL